MNQQPTDAIRKRYDRIAPFFDPMESLMERLFFHRWRALLWSRAGSGDILEVGVGTGKNFPHYPAGARMTGIDFSGKMLRRAAGKAARHSLEVNLLQMDVEHLAFPANSFDAVAATFVFCSVPDPMKGLREIGRVCKPGGRIILLEHVLSENRLTARVMDLVNPFVVRLVGANINRRTVENVLQSGLIIDRLTHLSGIVKLIEAHKPKLV